MSPTTARSACITGKRSRCLDELRRRAEAPFSRLSWDADEEDLSPLETIPDPDLLPQEVAERVELARSLREAIATLPPRLRPVVQLHCFRQLTFTEIALKLHMPASTVKTYFYRSLPHLRRRLAADARFASLS